MLLAGSNYSMRLFGMDIDYLCVLITKINLALYAPWFYIPDSFFPPREEKAVLPAANEPQTAAEPEIIQPAALFDLAQFSTEKTKSKKKPAGKTYTTEIEQPSLFDFD